MLKAPVNQFLNSSLVDGPGNRCAIFFQGCNFNCKFCHNPETIKIYKESDCNEGITFYSPEELFERVEKIKNFIRGITVSGGESTIHYKFLTEFFKLIKSIDLNILVDTNGGLDLSSAKFKELVSLSDGFMLDIKALNKESHIKITSVSNDIVLKNMFFLAEQGKLEEVRTVLLDGEDNFEIVDYVTKSLVPYFKINPIRYKLISYRPFGVREEFLNLKSVSSSELLALKELAIKNGFKDVVLI